MFLSQQQIQELSNIVNINHLVFTGTVTGRDFLTEYDEEVLTKNGIDLNKIPNLGSLETSFRFGMLAEALGHEKAKDMTYSDFKKFLASGKYAPLTSVEKGALDNVKQRAYTDIRGLGNRIGSDLATLSIETDTKLAKRYKGIIRSEAIRAVGDRKSISEFASALGHRTKDWARDFDRIADFIMHEAYDTGRAQVILQRYGGDMLVYKEVLPDACDTCRKLYLTGGIGSKPILFKVSDLLANGNNVGRKTADFRPVVGATHPFCRCTIFKVPLGMSWDEKSKDFNKPIKKYTSKTKIFVGGKRIA